MSLKVIVKVELFGKHEMNLLRIFSKHDPIWQLCEYKPLEPLEKYGRLKIKKKCKGAGGGGGGGGGFIPILWTAKDSIF